jgi:cytochrome b pre-mRNA-processing protein 3
MIFKRLFAHKKDVAEALYRQIVASARQPGFYADWGVPDTLDGRFDMISLHVFLVLDRLKNQGAKTQALRQQITDVLFQDMDRSLREMGVGDLSVGKKVRKMAEVYYGRITAYATAIETDGNFVPVLQRNLFPDSAAQDLSALAEWVAAARAQLADQDPTTGRVMFP